MIKVIFNVLTFKLFTAFSRFQLLSVYLAASSSGTEDLLQHNNSHLQRKMHREEWQDFWLWMGVCAPRICVLRYSWHFLQKQQAGRFSATLMHQIFPWAGTEPAAKENTSFLSCSVSAEEDARLNVWAMGTQRKSTTTVTQICAACSCYSGKTPTEVSETAAKRLWG